MYSGNSFIKIFFSVELDLNQKERSRFKATVKYFILEFKTYNKHTKNFLSYLKHHRYKLYESLKLKFTAKKLQ